MTREEKEQTGKYVLQMARLLEDGCYQQEMLLKAVHIIDEALEQEPTTKNNLGVDCISRADAISAVSKALSRIFVEYEDVANKIINKLPSVTPQEPILDKIKEDIQFIKDKCLPNNIAEEYEQKGLQEALDIIDKYKAESEDT